MNKLLSLLEKDDKALSLGRLCAVLSFLVFCVVTGYLVYKGQDWGGYEVLALTCLAYQTIQLCNKGIETKYFKVESKKAKEND